MKYGCANGCTTTGDMSGPIHTTCMMHGLPWRLETELLVSGGCPTTLQDFDTITDIFRDGASPELELKMAREDLFQAENPEPCVECGHTGEVDPVEVLECQEEVTRWGGEATFPDIEVRPFAGEPRHVHVLGWAMIYTLKFFYWAKSYTRRIGR